jgi:hypothetical protein
MKKAVVFLSSFSLAAVEKALPMVTTAKERERLEILKKQIREALEKK